jgi:signal transduction histidine kinase
MVLFWSALDILRQSARASRAERLVSKLNVQLQNAHDAEAKKISRELHDSVGQSLSAIKMALSGIEATADLPQSVRDKTKLASEAADESSREIRTLSYLLHPPLLEEAGFAAAATWFARGFSERSGIAVNLELPDDPLKLHPGVALALFRALQVGLSNVHRHSRSASADVLVTRNAADIWFKIRDSGRGHRRRASRSLADPPRSYRRRTRRTQGARPPARRPPRNRSNSTGTTLRVRLPSLDASGNSAAPM